jgi:pyrimidine deaminase RibD-like protein
VDARIKEVWIGCWDPFPSVAGKGRRFVEENGVTVHVFDEGLRDLIRNARMYPPFREEPNPRVVVLPRNV